MDRLEGIKKAIKQPLEGLLYDLDLMPEQCKTPINELRSGVVECQYEEIEQLRKDLKKYGEHHRSCKFRWAYLWEDCNCGLKQALKEG